MRWRWDQGRLDYFKFDNIKKIANCLNSLEGASMKDGDLLRQPLEKQTSLPFSPKDYSVWRNYGRTIECALLATESQDKLRTTEICQSLAVENASQLSSDEYFLILIQRFYAPFPAFSDYDANGPRQFPFCAVMRFLLSRAVAGKEPSVTLDEIFSFVAGNECKGDEPLSYYAALKPTGRRPEGDEKRQVREMFIALSQFSYLEWTNNKLELDVAADEEEIMALLEAQFKPFAHPKRMEKAYQELLRLGSLSGAKITIPQRESDGDLVFTEGKRVRKNHLTIERNRKLRTEFFRRLTPPFHCDSCGKKVNDFYPWVSNMLQIHHLLPLASPNRIGTEGTDFSKIVPICPNCHDAAHRYYREWLNSHNQKDFVNEEQAAKIYAEAKSKLRF